MKRQSSLIEQPHQTITVMLSGDCSRCEASAKFDAWKFGLEHVAEHLSDNISVLVARQEEGRIRTCELHELVDAEIDKTIALITAACQTAHKDIETRSKHEMEHLQQYINELEQSLQICHEQSEALSQHLATFNSTCDEMALCKLSQAVAQSYFIVKDHIGIVRANVTFLQKDSAVGPVAVSKTLCDELQGALCVDKLFAVSNMSEFEDPISRKDNAMVMLLKIFERLGICEKCFEGNGSGGVDMEKYAHSARTCCVSCGDRLRVHTINREAGVIDGRGPSARGALNGPQGVALITTNTDKLLFVSDTNNNRIQVYDSETGQYVRTLMSQILRPGIMTSLFRCDIATQLLFVSDIANNRVHVLDVSHGDVVNGSIVVGGAEGLAVMECHVNDATAYYLYLSAYKNRRILVYDVDTMKQVSAIGAVQLKCPHGLALLPSFISDIPESRLFVCDVDNHNVQVFNAMSGMFIDTIGTGLLKRPWEATVSSSLDRANHTLIISDCALHKLFLFDAIAGDSVRSIGSQGSAIGQFHYPIHVTAIRDDNDHIIIFTADKSNHRVQISLV